MNTLSESFKFNEGTYVYDNFTSEMQQNYNYEYDGIFVNNEMARDSKNHRKLQIQSRFYDRDIGSFLYMMDNGWTYHENWLLSEVEYETKNSIMTAIVTDHTLNDLLKEEVSES